MNNTVKITQAGSNPFGSISTPSELSKFGSATGGGLGRMLNIFIYVLIIGGGIYALFNFILAGYDFLGAGDDPKKIESAWAKIYQSIIGLIFMAAAFVIAAIIGKLFFNNYTFILSPVIPTP